MTKAKTSKTQAVPKKAESKTTVKSGKASAPAKETAKAAKPAKTDKPEKKAPEKAKAATAPAKKPAAKEKSTTVKIAQPKAKAKKGQPEDEAPATGIRVAVETTAEESRATPGFSNSGLGIKTASRKPALSIAPGVMILGRTVQVKPEQPPRPSERRLSKKEQMEIKSFLLERRERLLAGMRRELAIQKERADSKAADEVDKATDAYDEDLSFEIATANDQELEEIQVALEKIEKGTYGECEICGCAISPSRLKVLPSATTCVSCRGQEEMARRRDDGSPTFSMIGGEEGEGEAEPM